MNPIDQLRAARPAHLDTPVDERTRAAELSRAMSQARPQARPQAMSRGQARDRRRTVRPVWGLGLAGVAATAAVAVAVTATGGTTPTPRAPSAAAVTQSGQPAVRLSAKQLLLVAAESSLKAPAASGDYWYVEGVAGTAEQVGTAERYLVHSTTRTRLWVARSPKVESWFVNQHLGSKPAPGAEDAWKRDGSPTEWEVSMDKPSAAGEKAMSLTLDSKGGKPFGNPINVGDKVFELAGRNVSVAQLQALPADDAALRRYLLAGYEGHGTESDEKQDADSWLFQVTSGLLSEMPVKPAVRAAAYRVLAGIPGVRSLGEVTDVLGRKAQGIARTETGRTGRYERQLLVDPETGVLQTDQIVAVEPTGPNAWAKPGTITWWSATTTATWTDDKPVKP
ncbi:hypothetical protein Misp01_63480 [Microtetraspora sp. NBRC 13810]|uniref:CU044_5270 family protein n=1 Tax=Microtetraspora sp. NBRC 13810 TaxID=3030990 RepID=UPI0024A2F232|nr:CU044_5270 family protein [Microtetraspora sp. NBRC 13810]GLW11220.1 hypothetical protein Misp01_63480 [Microtetraspora sp. NBRC 13810]